MKEGTALHVFDDKKHVGPQPFWCAGSHKLVRSDDPSVSDKSPEGQDLKWGRKTEAKRYLLFEDKNKRVECHATLPVYMAGLYTFGFVDGGIGWNRNQDPVIMKLIHTAYPAIHLCWSYDTSHHWPFGPMGTHKKLGSPSSQRPGLHRQAGQRSPGRFSTKCMPDGQIVPRPCRRILNCKVLEPPNCQLWIFMISWISLICVL